MGLDRGIDSVKDELQMFIDSQKKKLDSEKRELKKAQTAYSPRDDLEGANDPGKLPPRKQNQRVSEPRDDYIAYERNQKMLRDEQRRDYKRFAAEKEFRRTGKVDPDLMDDMPPPASHRNDRGTWPSKRAEVSTPDIIDAYAALLRKKRAEERTYREAFDEPDADIDRKVRFDEQEMESSRLRRDIDGEDPFKWAREKARPDQRQKSAGETRIEKQIEVNSKVRSKSVPPSAKAGIFGGSESPDELKRRKEQYKRELEMQIKEKEDLKLREKLKRMGRISSSDDLLQVNKTEKSSKPKQSDTAMRRENERPESVQRNDSRSHRRKSYDDNEYIDRRFASGNRQRGDFSYRGMPPFDPYSQMMSGRYDMRGDPYLMQNAMFGGAPGYNGAMYGQNMPMYGQNMPMFGPNGATMPRLDANGDLRRGFDSKAGEDRFSRIERQMTPRTPQSPRRNDPAQQNGQPKSNTKKSPRGKAATAGVFGDNDTVDREAERAAKLAYQGELKQQMKEKQAAKEKEKKDRERYDAKIEAEIEFYNPWGKSGGGAPVKDQSGRLIADLSTMHKYNEAGTVVSPRAQATTASLSGAMSELPKDSPVLAALSEFQNAANTAMPTAAEPALRASYSEKNTGRGAALMELKGENKNESQKKEQLQYQACLKQQIEEKQRKKDEEEKKQREEEEKERQRLEEQRIKMEKEFLLEQERERKKEEEVRAKNDEMRKVAEQKRQEAERQRKEIAQDRFKMIQRRSSEMYQQSDENRGRPASPPVPTLQNTAEFPNGNISLAQNNMEQNGQQFISDRPKSRPIPTLAKQQSIEANRDFHAKHMTNAPPQQYDRFSQGYQYDYQSKSEQTVDENMRYLNSIRDQLFEANRNNEQSIQEKKSDNASQQRVIKQLAALRRQLSAEEQKVQSELSRNVEKYEVNKKAKEDTKRSETEKVEIFEKARIRRSSASRKPVQRVVERRHADVQQADDFKKITDATSMVDFRAKYPSKPISSSELDLQQREFVRLQEQNIKALRQAINDTSNQLMLSIASERPLTGKQRSGSKKSMLESNSKFISVDDPDNDDSRLPTARSMHRPLDQDSPAEDLSNKPKTPGGYSVNSMTSQAIDEMAARNEARLKRLKAQTGRDVMTPIDADDGIESLQNDALLRDRRPRTNQSD